GVRASAGAVDGPALPVGAVVVGAEPRSGPGGHLVALESSRLEQTAGQLQELPLVVGADLGQPAIAAAAFQQRAFLEAQAVAGEVLRPQLEGTLDGVAPGGPVLKGDAVDQVQGHVGEARRARLTEGPSGLGPVGA